MIETHEWHHPLIVINIIDLKSYNNLYQSSSGCGSRNAFHTRYNINSFRNLVPQYKSINHMWKVINEIDKEMGNIGIIDYINEVLN
jgi:hypothetical protein